MRSVRIRDRVDKDESSSSQRIHRYVWGDQIYYHDRGNSVLVGKPGGLLEVGFKCDYDGYLDRKIVRLKLHSTASFGVEFDVGVLNAAFEYVNGRLADSRQLDEVQLDRVRFGLSPDEDTSSDALEGFVDNEEA